MPRFPLNRWRLFAPLLGLALLVYLVYRLGPAKMARQLTMVGPGFILMFTAYCLGEAIQAFGLTALLGLKEAPPRRQIIASRYSATALNTVLPMIGIGGEPTRLLWLRKSRRREGVAGLILDRTVLVITDAFFLLVTTIVAILSLALPSSMEWIAFGIVASSVLMGGLLYWVTSRWGLAVPAMSALKLIGVKRNKASDDAVLVDAMVRKLWKKSPGKGFRAMAIHLVGRLVASGEIWIGLLLLGVPFNLPIALVVAALPLALSLVLSFIPGQIGAHEGLQAVVFSLLGLNPVAGVSLVILQRFRQIIFVPMGFALLSRAPRY